MSRQRGRLWLGMAITVALLFAAGSFFAGWRQSVLIAGEIAAHVHSNCLVDAQSVALRRALDLKMLEAERDQLAADLAALRLPGTPQSRAALAASVVFQRAAIIAQMYDLAHRPRESVAACHGIPR
jgi:hypothetical protein